MCLRKYIFSQTKTKKKSKTATKIIKEIKTIEYIYKKHISQYLFDTFNKPAKI